ncbi:MAG TPA: hypothetical protein VMS35_01560 [Nitrososphaeraceae archaeon]|nr:hypothetical protein [Nitrososphaeraceae archaeon]
MISLKENKLGGMINITQGGVIYSINFGPLTNNILSIIEKELMR